MFGKGNQFLLEELKKNGYTGNLEELRELLSKAESYSSLDKFYLYMKGIKSHSCDKENLDKIDFVIDLINKLYAKYPSVINCDLMFDPCLHFVGNSKINDNRFRVSFIFGDQTNSGSNGYMGESSVRILWGYDDHRKEETIIFQEKVAY